MTEAGRTRLTTERARWREFAAALDRLLVTTGEEQE
jgi:hypothetical protein